MTDSPEYIAALRTGHPPRVTIAKFTWHDVPVAVYNVVLRGNGSLRCDCPAGAMHRECRHLALAAPLFIQGAALVDKLSKFV